MAQLLGEDGWAPLSMSSIGSNVRSTKPSPLLIILVLLVDLVLMLLFECGHCVTTVPSGRIVDVRVVMLVKPRGIEAQKLALVFLGAVHYPEEGAHEAKLGQLIVKFRDVRSVVVAVPMSPTTRPEVPSATVLGLGNLREPCARRSPRPEFICPS